ncbi:MAG: P-loop NTPase fold protein [Suipraeoptans sp.]
MYIIRGQANALKREKYITALCGAIINHPIKENLVIGLYGKWGSGKTSIANLLSNKLESTAIEQRPLIIRFNPWNFSDQNQLLSQLISSIAEKLTIENEKAIKSQKKKKFMSKFIKGAEHISNVAQFIPGISEIAKTASPLLKKYSDALKPNSNTLDDLPKLKTAFLKHF